MTAQDTMLRGFLVCTTLLLVVQLAHAHGVVVNCRLEQGKLVVVARFSDQTPAQQAIVQVKDDRFEVIRDAMTDEAGAVRFDAPPPGSYQVVVDAGAGHRRRQTLDILAPDVSASSAKRDTSASKEGDPLQAGRLLVGLAIIAVVAVALIVGLRARSSNRAHVRSNDRGAA